MRINVHGGTSDQSKPSLCKSCKYATNVSGDSFKDTITKCSPLNSIITFPVRSCNEYMDASAPSLMAMQEIAYRIVSDRATGKIGFVDSRKFEVAMNDGKAEDDKF